MKDEKQVEEILGLAIDSLFCAVGRIIRASKQSDLEGIRYWACAATWMAAAAIQWLSFLRKDSLEVQQPPGLPEEIWDLAKNLEGFD